MLQKYSPEFRMRALQLIEERICAEQCSAGSPAPLLGRPQVGISLHTLRTWWK